MRSNMHYTCISELSFLHTAPFLSISILSRISLFDPILIFNLTSANQYYDSHRFLSFSDTLYISFTLSGDILSIRDAF